MEMKPVKPRLYTIDYKKNINTIYLGRLISIGQVNTEEQKLTSCP